VQLCCPLLFKCLNLYVLTVVLLYCCTVDYTVLSRFDKFMCQNWTILFSFDKMSKRDKIVQFWHFVKTEQFCSVLTFFVKTGQTILFCPVLTFFLSKRDKLYCFVPFWHFFVPFWHKLYSLCQNGTKLFSFDIFFVKTGQTVQFMSKRDKKLSKRDKKVLHTYTV